MLAFLMFSWDQKESFGRKELHKIVNYNKKNQNVTNAKDQKMFRAKSHEENKNARETEEIMLLLLVQKLRHGDFYKTPREYHCEKGSVFGVILVRIQSECGKIRTRITPNTDTFYVLYVRL